MRTRHFAFGAGIVEGYDPPPPPALLETLLRYAGQFEHDPYTHDASGRGVAACYVEPRDAAQHIEVLAGRVEAVLRELAEL